jgi:hypothetical protein
MEEMETVKRFSRFPIRRGAVVQIITNNYCNLHCEWCSLLCHLPFSKDSEIISHREKWDIPVSEAKLFCERFEGHYTNSIHKLLGGETTAMPSQRLYDIIDVFVEHDRKLKILSNGFNIFGLEKEYLNKLDSIELNDHGINHDHVVECFKYLKTFYEGELVRRTQDEHYNLGEARKHCIPGDPCNSFMNPIVLSRGVMYPCCIHPGVELWNNNWDMSDALRKAGWGLDNPNVASVVANWKNTVPKYVIDQCSNNCWVPRRLNKGVVLKQITLKKNDVIKKVNI